MLLERAAKRAATRRPAIDPGDARYEVRLARSNAEVDAILRLRFEVFNLEFSEGLASSYRTGRDWDPFDGVCDHLAVFERETGQIVGTYRMQTNETAASAFGFYTASEFDLAALPRDVLDDCVDLGRAAIAREHRNTRVLLLLWRGLAAYMAANRKRYVFGCCSVPGQDPAVAAAVRERLARDGAMHPSLEVPPRADYACPDASAHGIARDVALPPLFNIYLRHGARVCSPPAMDREFGTIDFFVLFDMYAMDGKLRRMVLDAA